MGGYFNLLWYSFIHVEAHAMEHDKREIRKGCFENVKIGFTQ